MHGAELSWDQIEATQNAANKKAGPRFVPGRSIPVPGTVSPSLQTTIAAPYRVPAWDANPPDAADWDRLINTLGDETAAATRDMQEKLGVTVEPTVIDGVKAFILTPKVIAPESQSRLLVNIHGGGYVYNPGIAGTEEPMSMAAYGGFPTGSSLQTAVSGAPRPTSRLTCALTVGRIRTRVSGPNARSPSRRTVDVDSAGVPSSSAQVGR